MFSRLHRRFGVARPLAVLVAVAVAVVASVPALADPIANTALSLAGVNKTAKKALKKANAANKRAMTPGPKGDPGPAGAVGAAGAKGDNGPQGAQGAQGQQGPAGNQGATGPAGPAGPTGPAGPDGPTGPAGPEGSPWTAGGTLPAGKTQTGTWSFGIDFGFINTDPDPAPIFVPISFPIPLAAAIGALNVHTVPVGGPAPAGCTGGTVANPAADAGHLCVYAGTLNSASYGSGLGPISKPSSASFEQGADKSGANLVLFGTAPGALGAGTWAVTAPN